MRSHIDWITFTLAPRFRTTYADGTTYAEMYHEAIEQAFIQTFGADETERSFGGEWEKQERSRAPYVDAWKLGDRGITVFASETLNHLCVEISGQGCEALISQGRLNAILSCVVERVTRIDIACDIGTNTRPPEFVGKLKHKRMTASGYQTSASGETCYVGSQKSDRYARVYRYNDPHPRSHLLRVEHVFRRAYAKVVAKQCLNSSVEAVADAAGQAFGWSHVDWKKGGDHLVDITHVAAERNGGKTLFWLISACAPAFKKLVAAGTIRNPQEFIDKYFLS